MRTKKPSSFVRGNTKNAISIKKRLSSDYSGVSGAKTAKELKEAAEPARRAKSIQKKLQNEAVRAFAHWKMHGDYSAIIKLAQNARGQRTHDAVLAWFEHVTRFRWDKQTARFIGKDRHGALTVEAAASTSIWAIPKPEYVAQKIGVPLRALSKCKVCGFPAMANEDICFGHQSE
jgi:hypothetical protein